jgi:hypothetical protein
MREAAKQAGILAKREAGETRLTFLAEPEAAALATLADMRDRCDIKVRANPRVSFFSSAPSFPFLPLPRRFFADSD